MSLTNERLKEIINKDNDYIPIFRQMAEELLQLRSLRDSGDEAVESKVLEIERWIGNTASDSSERWSCRQAAIELQNLYDIAIARGRTRTDAVNKAAEWAKECEALYGEIERLKGEIRSYAPPVQQLPKGQPKAGHCAICGLPMRPGESMFKFHGFSESCAGAKLRIEGGAK